MKKLAIVAMCLIMSAASGISYAQMQSSASPGAGMGAMSNMMSMCMMMHPAIAVDDDYIYILRGNEVFKLQKSDLKIISTGTLPPTPAMNSAGGEMPGGAMAGQGPAVTTRPEMEQVMQNMRQMQPSQFEQSFLGNMIRHHQGAIELSQLALTKATHPELRKFAENVITKQSREQRQFASWLKNWYKASSVKQPRPIDDQMTSNLRNLSGRDFEIQYMRDMIIHHSEAVSMGQSAEQKAVHPEVKTAAANIVKQQSAEINELRRWLSSWYGEK